MIRPTNNRILVSLSKEDYQKFTTDPNVNLYRGTVYSLSEGTFSENPVATDGQGNFSWVRRPPSSGLEVGDSLIFVRDGLCQPAMIRGEVPVNDAINSTDEGGLLHLVLIEEANIFAAIYTEKNQG